MLPPLRVPLSPDRAPHRAWSQVDIKHLRELALSRGGLANDRLRRKAWMHLLGTEQNPLQRFQGAWARRSEL